jgi:hypothetical protein
MHDVIGQRRVQDGRGVELLAGDGGADNGENAGADDRSDTQRGERPRAERLLEPMLGLLRFGDQLVDGLTGEQLVRQISAPERGMNPLKCTQKFNHGFVLMNTE